MWGIIPAAGKGSRIQPLAFSKELLPVGSRLAKARPLTVPWAVKVATILLGVVCVTSMARLLFSSAMRPT